MKKIACLAVYFACLLSLPVLMGQTPAPPSEAAAAMNAALRSLKDSNWKQADESFDLVLMFAPKYAPAYIGKLCAELKVPEEKLLGTLDPLGSIDDHPFFKAALECADATYKRQVQGYADAINAKLKAMEADVPKDDRKAGDRMTLTINGVEYAFRWCPAVTFMMGSPQNERDRNDSESQHRVRLSRGFWMLETEVTQAMWVCVMGNNPSQFKDMKFPVEQVSWDDCQEYITKLNAHLAGIPGAPAGFKFSLPTEAQWEYACRAGTTTAYCLGNTLNQNQANFGRDQTTEVGKYPANAWGLRDMHGNVWEWCLDRYGDYPSVVVTDPVGALEEGSARVFRGGSWSSSARLCRSAIRRYGAPSDRSDRIGVRISLVRAE